MKKPRKDAHERGIFNIEYFNYNIAIKYNQRKGMR